MAHCTAWPRVTKKFPAPLVAIVVVAALATVLTSAWPAFHVATIGSRFHTLVAGRETPGIPQVPPLPMLPWGPSGMTFGRVRELLSPALAIAMLGAIESLLSAVVADAMTGKKHDPNAELVGLGLGNIVAPFFGGIAATGALARTATNIRAGATSPLAAVIHSVFLLTAILLAAPLVAYVPMASLAALLLLVAWNMSDVRHFTHVVRVAPGSDVAVALNTAFMGDGAVIRIAAGSTIERPLHLIFVASEKPAATFVRSLVVVEERARAMLIESHEGPSGSDYQVNAALELFVGEQAHVDHVKIITEGADALHVSTLAAAIGAQARFNSFTFTAGGAVVRNQLFLKFDGEGTVAGIRGATLLKGRQHADTTLVANHNARDCQSREMFKAVLDDEAHSVFQGRIIVRSHAQKTDAKMMTQALLLSERAEAYNKPELEIFADDVQCGHGATSGALDDDLKFYLMARGIPTAEAEALLIQAFLGEAIEGIEHAGLREALMDSVVGWLKARA